MTTFVDTNPASENVEHLDIPVEHSPTRDHPIRVRSRPVPYGVRIALHTHPWAQVAYTSRGVLRVATADSTWMVPPSRAIWVPPNVTHEVVIVEDAYLRTLYVDASVVPPGLGACRVVEVSPLLREVIAALDEDAISRQRERLLGTLALDEIIRSQPLPLSVPMPNDKRLRALCDAVLSDPSHSDLERWSSEAGASTRTIARLFRRELGVSFFAMAPAGRARTRHSASEPGTTASASRTGIGLSKSERFFGDVSPRFRAKSSRVFSRDAGTGHDERPMDDA